MNRLRALLLEYGIDLEVTNQSWDGKEYYEATLELKYKYTFIQQANKHNGILVVIEGKSVAISRIRATSAKEALKLIDQSELENHKRLYNYYKDKARRFFEPFKVQRITFKEKQIDLIALLMKKEFENN